MVEFKGRCGIVARIVADSIAPNGKRLTTFEFEYNRWILAELNTHRAVSKNSASSRAVPFERMLELIMDAPAMPVHWGMNQGGMTAKEELSKKDIAKAKKLWIATRDSVIKYTKKLYALNLHKQVINRLSEPWSMMKTVASATDWNNLLWLRDDEEAQPEFRELAGCIRECLEMSVPVELGDVEWHLPYINTIRVDGILKYFDSDDKELTLDEAKQISSSCTAQVSYRRLNETKEKAIDIYKKLISGRKLHASPTEHQGTPIVNKAGLYINDPFEPHTWEDGVTHVDRSGTLHSGNFTGWIQYRQTLPNNVKAG